MRPTDLDVSSDEELSSDLNHVVANEISHITPGVKVIVMLRNPTERYIINRYSRPKSFVD